MRAVGGATPSNDGDLAETLLLRVAVCADPVAVDKVVATVGVGDVDVSGGRGHVEIRLLGPVALVGRDQEVDLGPPRRRLLLAMLALDLNRPVALSRVVDRLWEEDPPAQVSASVYGHVSRLRSALLQARAGGADDPRSGVAAAAIRRTAAGYVLEADRALVDVHRFIGLAEEPGAVADEGAPAVTSLRTALDLWNGPALAGLSGRWADDVRADLHERRLAAFLRWAAVAVPDDAPEVVTRARALLLDHPYAEPLAAVLLTALAADGRAAEALAAYGVVRARLAADLGIGPGADLRALHEKLLAGGDERRDEGGHDPAHPRTAGDQAVATVSTPPMQLPPEAGPLVGRAPELAALGATLLPAQGGTSAGRSRRPSLTVLTGTAGVGKTALAVHWAHHVSASFPDGVLFADLRGHGPDQPLPVGHALAAFLRALGVPAPAISPDLHERAALFRSRTSTCRLLVVLDDVAVGDDIGLVLPSGPDCSILVTSRDSLPGAVARLGARRISLSPLGDDDGLALLQTVVATSVDTDPDSARQLVRACAGLPLALRLAADLVASHPGSLTDVVEGLRDTGRALDLLDAGGDPRAAVRTVFSWSYAHLPVDAALTFRRLGLSPGPDLSAASVAALAGLTDAAVPLGDPRDRRRRRDLALARLEQAHLVTRTAPGRFAVHDLLQAFAAERVAAEDGDEVSRAAFDRLAAHLLSGASAAMDTLHPAEAARRPHVTTPDGPRPDVSTPDAARRWLDSELDGLVALAGAAAGRGRPGITVDLAATLARHLEHTGRLSQALTLHRAAALAARSVDDRVGLGQALLHIGNVWWRSGDQVRAAAAFRAAIDLASEAKDPVTLARAHNNLGTTFVRWGRGARAEPHFQAALALARDGGMPATEARAVSNLGVLRSLAGRYDEALAAFTAALAVNRRIGNRDGVSRTLVNLADTHLDAGDLDAAQDLLKQALHEFQSGGDTRELSYAVDSRAGLLRRRGLMEAAVLDHLEALRLARDAADTLGVCHVLNGLGETLAASGDDRAAADAFTEALTIARDTGTPIEAARAHEGLARLAPRGSRRATAHWQEALRLYLSLESPGAARARAALALTMGPSRSR